MIDEKQRLEKIALAELKERVSQFLYNNFIDFERDKGVIINEVVFHPSFFLNKHAIIIDCFIFADPQNPEYEKRVKLYKDDGVKFITLDLKNQAMKNTEAVLREQLPKLGCNLGRN